MIEKIRYGIYRLKYVHARNLPLSKPVDLSIELAASCQSRCVYCYFNDAPHLPFKQGLMKRDLAVKVVREGAEIGVHSFKTNYRGESTLNNNFEEITHLAKELAHGSTYIERMTNSNFQFLTNREDIFRGLCNQTKIKVSFDSFRKDIYEKQRFKSKFDLAIANVNKFYNYPGRNNELVIQSVRTKLNADEDLKSEIKKRWPSATASIRDVVEGRTVSKIDELKNKERDTKNRQACVQASARLMVRWDGSVGACCPDIKNQIEIGNANTMHLRDIFKSQKAIELRRSLKNKSAFNSDPCKSCSSFESYKGWSASWNS